MGKQTYREQLLSPMWQRKRLEIMQRDNWTCRICGCTNKTLNVHHLNYERDRAVYDYDNDKLITLCEVCHSDEHLVSETIYQLSFKLVNELKSKGFLMFDIHNILSDLIDTLNGAPTNNDIIFKNIVNDIRNRELISDNGKLKMKYK